jgi:predicted Zn-dependent protease
MMMGKWRLDCGDLDGAQSYLRSAMALLPDDGVIRISLAEVLTMMGKRVEAQGLMDDFEPANALEVKLFDRIRPQLT